jgi:hypothetical protein
MITLTPSLSLDPRELSTVATFFLDLSPQGSYRATKCKGPKASKMISLTLFVFSFNGSLNWSNIFASWKLSTKCGVCSQTASLLKMWIYQDPATAFFLQTFCRNCYKLFASLILEDEFNGN